MWPTFNVESDSVNVISWMKYLRAPWKIQFLFNEIIHLVFELQVSFQHVSRSTNGMADCLAKQGVDHSCNLSGSCNVVVIGGWHISLLPVQPKSGVQMYAIIWVVLLLFLIKSYFTDKKNYRVWQHFMAHCQSDAKEKKKLGLET